MTDDFLAWFKAELIEALEGLDWESVVKDATTTAPAATGQVVRTRDGRPQVTNRQSNLVPRPGQTYPLAESGGKPITLGDNNRNRRDIGGKKGFVPKVGAPWAIPCPPLPQVEAACGVRLDSDPHAPLPPSFPYREAPDHYLDAGYARETLSGHCADPTDYLPIEVSGLFVQPRLTPCHPESRVRLEHLAQQHRPSIRMPYAGGVENGMQYARVVVIPMKSCRQYVPFIPT